MTRFKKSISIILSVLILISVFTVVPLTATAESSGDYEYSVRTDGSVMITGYNGSESELVIPKTIDGKNVTIIGERAFRGNTNIVNVTLPFGIVEIGKSAFWDCKNMQSITIPSSVNRMNYSSLGKMMGEDDGTYIRGFVINGYSGSEAEAYSQNGDLDITFNSLSETKTSADGIYDYVITEDDSAIITQYNGEEEEIAVPDKIDGHKVIRIGNGMFSSNLRNDRDRYLQLKKLKKVTLPDSIISIGYGAFYNCSNIVEITVPDSVKYISGSAFSNCNSLSKLDLPKGLIYLGEYALFGTAIENLNLGNMLDEISRALCWDCTALKTVNISDSIKSIEDDAFNCCENLKNLDIPQSVSYISPGAFYACSVLESINIAEGNENYSSINGVLFNKEKTELLLYPSGKKESTFNVPDGIERLESGIFNRNFNLKVINLPASVSRIEDNVFTGCFALTDINVDNDNQMYSSKDGVLFNKNRSTLLRYPINKSLSEYVLPDEVTNLPERCFSNAKTLTNVVLPKGLISIGAEAFVNCSGLKSITIPANTKRIGYWALGWYSEGEDEDKYEDFVITGYSKTVAETYAEENGFEFISLGETPTEPITTEPAEGFDEYGYLINGYYLAGTIKGEDKGLNNVDKKLRFVNNPEKSEFDLFLDSVYLNAGDSVKIVQYKGKNTFEVYWDGFSAKESGEYQINFNPVTSSFVYGLKVSSGTSASGYGYSYDKKSNPIKVSVKTKTVKLKKLRKKAQKVKTLNIKNAEGKVSYKLVKSGITKKIRKLVKINSKGVITIKKWKKAKKGTYKIKVKVSAAGNASYKKGEKAVTVIVKIK